MGAATLTNGHGHDGLNGHKQTITAAGFGTRAVHAGSPKDPVTGAVIEASAPGQPIGTFEYSRSSNPNRENFEHAVASLEGARYALAFSSGSAALATILQSLPPQSHVVSVSDVYGGTHRYFTKVAQAHGISVSFTGNLEQDLPKLVRPETRLVWVETPSNPTLSVVDIRAVADIAHEHKLLLLVDNTFLSPYGQTPLAHGADIVVHSVTKYINGHSDVVMGVAAFNSDALREKLSFLQNAIGAVPSAFDSWLAHRGLKTLHLRAQRASDNALAVAAALERSPDVLAVNYPGLASHPRRDVVERQHRRAKNGSPVGGGMLSFRVRGGAAAAAAFVAATRVFALAESLGGVESLVEVPAVMTHAGIPVAEREAAGVYDDLVRVSCGVEDGDDLVADVEQALRVAVAAGKGEAVPGVNGANGANGANGTHSD